MVSREIEKLQSSIQTLCRSANPLGKIMDYVQVCVGLGAQRTIYTPGMLQSAQCHIVPLPPPDVYSSGHSIPYVALVALPENDFYYSEYMSWVQPGNEAIPQLQQALLNPLTAEGTYVYGFCEIDFLTEQQSSILDETLLKKFSSLNMFYHDFRNHLPGICFCAVV